MKPYFPTDVVKNKICEKYLSCHDLKETASDFNLKPHQVFHILKKRGIQKRLNPVSHEEAQRMNDLYQEGFTSYEVGAKMNRSFKTVTNNIVKIGGKIRDESKRQKKWSLNETYFEKIDSPIKAYLLGFIYADGNVFGNRFKMSLWETDKYFLELFAKEIGFDGELYCEKAKIVTRQDMWSLTVYSRVFTTHLRDKGVIDNKVNVLTFPKWLDREYWRPFIHGLFDGDGCITSSRQRNELRLLANIAGAKPIVTSLQEIVEKETGLVGQLLKKENKNGARLDFHNRKAVAFLNYIYTKRLPFFLKRKFFRFRDLLRQSMSPGSKKRQDYKEAITSGLEITSQYEQTSYLTTH